MARLEPERAFSRTTGHDRVVDEFVIKFARTLQIASERIYSNQASVPVQLGLNVSGLL